MKALGAGLTMLLWVQLASAQAPSTQPTQEQQAPAAKPSTKSEAAPNAPPRRAVELAQALNTKQYGTAFYSGAQAELVVPGTGVSSLLIGYDAVWTQVDLSLGFGVGGDPVTNKNTNDVYNLVLRFAFPLHYGIRADYALAVGGGTTIINPPRGSAYAIATAALGARFRVFMSPNCALAAGLGFSAFIRGENPSFVMAARPLGSAAVVYFFR
jgi:hypothetical protein